MSDKTKSVVFGMPQPDGSVKLVSNDPYYNAKQVVQETESDDTAELDALRAENAALKAAAAKAAEDDDPDTDTDEFTGLNGAQLKEKAAELEVDISGLKKVGQVRQALRDHVAAQD